jgi:putative endonuclease
MWHVYILECRNGSLYTGVTTDVERRFHEHRNGSARYTSYNPPERLVYSRSFKRKVSAFRREAEIKRWPRRRKLALIAGQEA